MIATKPVDAGLGRRRGSRSIARCKRHLLRWALASCDSSCCLTARSAVDGLHRDLLASRSPVILWYDRFSAGSFVHAALLRDVRLQFHGLPLRLPASPHCAVPHHRSRRIDVCVGDVPRVSDLLLRVFGPVDRRAGGSRRSAPRVDDLESRARGFFTRLRGDH